VVAELLGQAERLGDTTGTLLVAVGEAVDAELMTVAEEAQELAAWIPPVTSMSSVMSP